VLPVPVLLRGLSTLLAGLYEARPFFERALRSLEVWQPRASQVPPALPMAYNLRVLAASMWRQGIRSPYKREYWKFLSQLIRRHARHPAKLWLGFMVLLSAHHFLIYSREVAGELEQECVSFEKKHANSAVNPNVAAALKLAARA
jgi:hypothetical protein